MDELPKDSKRYFDKIQFQKMPFLSKHPTETIAALFMFLGIIFSFFYETVGALFVGLAFGIGFYTEIHHYCTTLRRRYTERGLYKILMLIGTVVFLLIVTPIFVICVLVGYGILHLVRHFTRKPPLV